MSELVDQVFDWMWKLGELEGAIPPFCVEVNLRDGTNYYLHSVHSRDSESQSMIMRIWDFRMIQPEDMDDLKSKLNTLKDRQQLDEAANIHPKLDYADVRLHLQNIDYVIEWNDRLFPREERGQMIGLLPEASVN